MNTNQLKRFAKDARIKLLDQVGRKLEFVLSNSSQSFIDTYAVQIQSLKDKIQQTSREQVIEMVAYTWFNRLMALRFMDANGYTIPKVVTPQPGMTNPEILQNALAGNIEPDLHLDRQRLNDLLDGRTAATDAHTEAYKMLLVAVCNQWHKAMPFMFERISDYTELLLPDDLLSDYSIVADLRNGMSDDDCQHEEILGWLYQFYISDENERLIKSKNPYKKHELAPASQLFTPKWIVKYMVDNTLGQLWSEMNPSTSILKQLEFYITPAYKDQLVPRTKKKLEEIRFFDPCVGSGHILVYAFDVFYLMYEEEGYNSSEIPELIIKHNLFGTDIDERAAQIAAFVLTMKGRRKNGRFLRNKLTPNITFYQDFEADPKFSNAKTIGSLINVTPQEMNAFKVVTGSIYAEQQQKLKQLYTFLGQRYDCVVTNPPYIPSTRFESDLKTFINQKYPDFKSDLFACFMQRVTELTIEDGFIGYICPFVWMFISSYEKLRRFVIENTTLNSLIQLEYNAFEPACVSIATFTLQNKKHDNYKGSYVRLVDFKGHENQAPRTLEAIQNSNCGWFYTANQNDFAKVPSCPFGYWASEKVIETFLNPVITSYSELKKGMDTGKNEFFIRLWHEVNQNVSKYNSLNSNLPINIKWVPYRKGGTYRKWFGNNDYLINWANGGYDICNYPKSNIRNKSYYFKETISWTLLSSSYFGARYYYSGGIFDANSPSLFSVKDLNYILGFFCSNVCFKLLNIINPTLAFQKGDLEKLPLKIVKREVIEKFVKANLSISTTDWDAHETSWDFQHNELLKLQTKSIKIAFEGYKNEWSAKFYELHRNEEELNRQFIEIYGLQDELTPDVPLQEITILQEEGKIVEGQLEIQTAPVMLQLISYAVGCMFGRYSLDKPGLILANQGDTLQDYFQKVYGQNLPPSGEMKGAPDSDNIIPILDGEWFTDDIVGRFHEFLKVAFGTEHFEENLRFIEDSLGKDVRKYLVKDFYNDHIKRYKKRPIYWMFSSPKGHFKALIYMHRYQSDLCSRMLNEYLQTFIGKLESAKNTQTMFTLREDISGREKTLASKEIERLEEMLKDCRKYESTLFTIATQKIAIDLDDGVKVNYQKFKEVLVPIKGLEKEEE